MAADSASPRQSRFRPTLLICVILLAFFAAMSYSAILQKSPIFDEPQHVVGGYLIRWMGDYRVDSEDPALFGWLTTIPQRQSDLGIQRNDPRLDKIIQARYKQGSYIAEEVFRTPRTAPDESGRVEVYAGGAYINRARAVFTCLGVLLGALLAWWGYRLAGAKAALIAVVLFAFDPNFLAHSSIVKNDVPMALLMLWLMYSVWSFGEGARRLSLLNIGIACALAVNIKFSGLLLGALVVVAVCWSFEAMLPGPWPAFGRELTGQLHRFEIMLDYVPVCSFVLVMGGDLGCLCDFRYSMTPDPIDSF